MLAWLFNNGYPVPKAICLASSAHESEWRRELPAALAEVDPPWCARSSSSVEDAPSLAYAGIFQTVLGLYDLSSLVDAIDLVRASVRSDAAKQYAIAQGVALDDVHMAVIIQHVVAATVAGVAFGCDPLTGEPVVVIEANHGLGVSVVDGSVTPDSIEVLQDGSTRAPRVGSKKTKVVLTPAGVERRPCTDAERERFVLDESLVTAIARIVRRLEVPLGGPQDLEWAAVGCDLFVLQARPVTAVSST